jgi:hypothetical protein
MATSAEAQTLARAREARFGLPDKPLVLTILFVMLAEVLAYVPSVATFKLNWPRDRLPAPHAAVLVRADTGPLLSGMPEGLGREILERAIAFCQSTLSYGQAQELPPDRRDALIHLVGNQLLPFAGNLPHKCA